MSVFDSLLKIVWQIAKNEEDFLTTFARLTSDKERVEKVLALPQLQDFCVTDGFSGKCEARAEDLRLLGDKLYLETAAASKQPLALYTSAIKLAPPGSSVLARSYMGRSQVLLRMGYTGLALEDAKRALEFELPKQDAIRLLSLAASCHQQNGDWAQAEEVLQEALDKLRNSELENNIKAAMSGEIIQQLKTIVEKKQLDQRKKKSRKKTGAKTAEPRPGDKVLLELTYGKNHDIPAASAAVRLCHSPDKGRYMEATRDIKLGSVLIAEEPYAWALSREAMAEHCLHCCRLAPAPIPCVQCSTVCYCSEECRDEGWQYYHRLECSILNHVLSAKELSKMALLVYRIAITAHNRVKNVPPVSTETEKTIESGADGKHTENRSFQMSDSTSERIFKEHSFLDNDNTAVRFPFISGDYASVYGQVTNSSSRTPADLLKRTTSAFFLMLCLRHVAPEIGSDAEITIIFLRHLQSCSCNAYQITEQLVPDGDVRTAAENELGGGAYPTISLCNHSCNPNVVRHCHGRTCIVRAVRTIKKGEEILDNYGPHFLSNDLDERQKELGTQYFFRCNCEACLKKWPTVDKLQDQVIQYRCVHCSVNIGPNLSNLKTCPNCKKKCDYGKIAKRLQVLSRDYNRALEDLIQRRLRECLATCIEYCDVMDLVVVHPNKSFVRCQQAITLCWSLWGNTNTQK